MGAGGVAVASTGAGILPSSASERMGKIEQITVKHSNKLSARLTVKRVIWETSCRYEYKILPLLHIADILFLCHRLTVFSCSISAFRLLLGNHLRSMECL